jgi:hypothetical protein
MKMSTFGALSLLACGVVAGSLLTSRYDRSLVVSAAAQAQQPPADPASLQNDLAFVKSIAPTQSHIMADVAIQFGNLWFAARKRNWALATYYLGETRGRINWVVRINPAVKKQVTGEVIDIKGIFDGIDTGSITPLRVAIEKKDLVQFVAAYKVMLESCYACHKSVGRPYLRPRVPLTSTQPIINVDPAAAWPQ